MNLSPPPVFRLNTLRALYWALDNHHVERASWDRIGKVWTLKTNRGFFSWPTLLRTIQEAYRAR